MASSGVHAFAHGDELVLRHQLAHRLAHVGGEAHVAVGENADELAGALAVRAFDHRNAGDAIALHQRQRIGERRVGRDGHRVHHHAAFEFLHPADLLGLLLDGEVPVDHAHAAGLRHGDGEAGFGHRVHGGGDQRNAEFDGLGEAGSGIDLAGQDFGGGGHQQHIVEGQRFADGQGRAVPCERLSARPRDSASAPGRGTGKRGINCLIAATAKCAG